MKRTSAALLAAPLVASLLLAGCGGADKPGVSSSSDTSVVPSTAAPSTTAPSTSAGSPASTSPGPKTDPNIPAAARAHTPAGAEAFVRYFYSQVNVAWTKPTSGLVKALSVSSCKSCAALEATAAELVKKGQHYDGVPATIVSVNHLGEGIPGRPEILVRFTQERRNVVNASGRVVLTDQQKQGKFVVTLSWSGRGWSIATVKSLA